MLLKNEVVSMQITDLTDEGNGVGKVDGFTLFVPGTAPGDQLLVRVVKLQKSFGFGIVEKLLLSSPERQEVDCAVYRQCGGCSLRHLKYEAELRIKENWVRQHLRRIGGIEAPVLPILPSAQQEAYRNKAQYPVRVQEDGSVCIGMFSQRSHRVVSCTNCRLQPPHFEEILKTIQVFCTETHLSVYNEEKHVGLLRHVYLRFAQATQETMVCLVVNGNALPQSARLVALLQERCKTVCSLILNVNQARTNVILGQECHTLWGKDKITDVLCGVQVELSPLSFYQVNHAAAQRLYGVAAQFAQLTGNELLLDLYCGAGTIGLSMSKKVKELIGVEIIPAAVEDAKRNARQNNITNARFLCSDAKGAALQLQQEGLAPAVVVLDPPRRGCEAQVLATVAQMNPARIVMISCNSATLARDLAVLESLGYGTQQVQPVDMFPRTAHVECVALLVKSIK